MNWEEFQGRLPDVGAMSAQTVAANAVAAAVAGVVVWTTLYVAYKTAKWAARRGVRVGTGVVAWLFAPGEIDRRQVLAARLVALFDAAEGWELNEGKQIITKRPLESTRVTFSPADGVKVNGRPLAELALTARQTAKVLRAAAVRRIEMVRAAAVDALVPSPARPNPAAAEVKDAAGKDVTLRGWEVLCSFTDRQQAPTRDADAPVPGPAPSPEPARTPFGWSGLKPGQLPGAVYAVYRLPADGDPVFVVETHVTHIPYISRWLCDNAVPGSYAIVDAALQKFAANLVRATVQI